MNEIMTGLSKNIQKIPIQFYTFYWRKLKFDTTITKEQGTQAVI